ncbi:uncharacterized protein G2W53_015474 [Senna tora]|uniref:Retrotransposon Copia-like N-terminal domain-containing protein n=1 Tax=Senna tora TaxID=362788 RepID=A0A835C522_9FABA|nr:uncharacterized protein G2W53_015474 [Senna tora]
MLLPKTINYLDSSTAHYKENLMKNLPSRDYQNTYKRYENFGIRSCTKLIVALKGVVQLKWWTRKDKEMELRAQLVVNLLTTTNYLTWSRSLKIALRAKNKLGFIDGSYVKPNIR